MEPFVYSNFTIISVLVAIPCVIMFSAAFCIFLRKKTVCVSHFPEAELVIPVRNESLAVLQSLKQRLEAIHESAMVAFTVVDDGSSTPIQLDIGLSTCAILRVESGLDGSKKNALSTAIEASNAEWIITSDADTRNLGNWPVVLKSDMCPGIDMIAGPVFSCDEPRFLAKYCQYESLCLWTIALASQFLRAPLLCSGANLAFRRKAWFEVGGYASHAHILSGDDVLLMHQFWQRNRRSVAFCVEKDAACFTMAPDNWWAWFRQRRRWISKTGHVQHPFKMLLVFFVALWLYLPFLLGFFSPTTAALLLAFETLWLVFLTHYYSLKLPRIGWLIFRLTYPLILPFVYFIRPSVWKAQAKR